MKTEKRPTEKRIFCGFDEEELEVRPASYWEHTDPLQAILANVSGRARREMITDYWNSGCTELLDAELLKDELTDKVRADLGRIHPFFMGGEYLPSRLPDEVTIVRIQLESTTFDVIELRARRVSNGRILLRWVDEYETAFHQPKQTITRPFSFGELITFIAASGTGRYSCDRFPLVYNRCNYQFSEDAEGLRNFTSFDSDFYPDLSSWCAIQVDRWILREERKARRRGR